MSWESEELAAAELGDNRRVLRLMRMVGTLVSHAEQSIPRGFGSWSEARAAYRLLENSHVAWRDILSPHTQQTANRCLQHAVVLVAQDTTEINLTSHSHTTGLGYLAKPNCQGVLLHSCLAMTPEGVPLGVVDQHMWVRPHAELGKRATRHQRPTRSKESQRWINGLEATQRALDHPGQVVLVGDRESDIYDLFAAPRKSQMHLLVRVRHERRRVSHCKRHLLHAVESTPVRGELQIQLPRRGKQAQRMARLKVRWQTLDLCAPTRGERTVPTVRVQVVLIEEQAAPEGQSPVRWLLATTLPVEDLDSAAQVVGYYTRRWLIERFHFTLKSGCLIEKHRLATLDNVCRAVACFSIVAWRLLWLTTVARESPNVPCTVVLSDPEWQTLEAVAEQRFGRPSAGRPPDLGEAIRLIAKLGGHLGRKCDGPPGVKTVWRGLARLSDITVGWLLSRPPPDSSEDCGSG